MTEVEEGSLVTGTFKFEMNDQLDVLMEFNHDSKASMDYKTNVLISRGSQLVNLTGQLTTVIFK